MAKLVKRLTDLKIKQGIEPASYPDGNGLYLQVRKSGAKNWFYRYQVDGKGRKKGLGSYPTVSLSSARAAAQECHVLRDKGVDPIEHYKAVEAERKLSEIKGLTFEECAEAYIDARKAEWKNAKHHYQWHQSLNTYVYPDMGALSVQDIDLGLVLKVLEPIWETKTETATRVRQRIEAILDWAKVRQYRGGENPARWRGHLDKILPSPNKIKTVVHQAAMDYRVVPRYYQSLRLSDTVSTLALAFVIQTALRSKEVRCAEWDEIDFDDMVWTVPAARMKSNKEHRVPLTSEMCRILELAKVLRQDSFVFPSTKKGQGISDTAVRKQLQDECPDVTVHGFRSSFRDWCAESTNYPRELAEKALGHVLGDKVEAAYQRGDLLEKRRELMAAWTNYCSSGEKIGIN
jgi:integrase